MTVVDRIARRLDGYASLAADAWMGARMAVRLPSLLKKPITIDEARAILRDRLSHRVEAFLSIARKAIYEHEASPYRELLSAAGCEYGDLERLTREEGLDGALKVLFERGVYLTVDEFKGRTPVVRGSTSFQVDPPRTQNPFVRQHVLSRTSGSRSARTVVAFDLAFIRDCAVNHCLGLAARGGQEWVKADWEGPGGGATFRIVKFGCLGSPPARLFLRGDPDRQNRSTRWTDALMRAGHRLARAPLPEPLYVPHDAPLPIARWIGDTLRSGRTPYVFGFASSLVRLAQEAADHGIDIEGAVLHMGGEPITRARLDVVESAGATGIPRYGSVETGMIGYGCLHPEHADDMHHFHDLYAIVQPGHLHETLGIPPNAIFVTTLRPTAPFVLLNVCMGDQAVVAPRSCGCPLEELGWPTHLHTVRSYEKLTTAGATLWDTDVIRVLEEALPGRFGGGPTSYQLIEDDVNARPRLTLRVDPDVGPVEEEEVKQAFLEGIHAAGNPLWQSPGFLRVVRQAPSTTGSGKILHLHVDRGSDGQPGDARS